LVAKEISLFEEEHFKKHENGNSLNRTIELKNIKTVLNGYETAKPLNQKAKELEITIFISTSGEQILKKIEDTIGKHFHFAKVEYSSFLLASFAVVRDVYLRQEDFLLGQEVERLKAERKKLNPDLNVESCSGSELDLEKLVLSQAVWSHLQHKTLVYNNKTIVFE